MTIPIDLASALVIGWEPFFGQRHQSRSFYLVEPFTDLLASSAVDTGVSHLPFPTQKELVVLSQRGKAASFEGIVFDVLDAAFDFAFMAWCVRFSRQEDEAVVLCEGDDLRVQIGIKPISLGDGCFEVINDQRLGNPTKGVEGILDNSDKVLGGLFEDRF